MDQESRISGFDSVFDAIEKSRNVAIEALYRCLKRHFVFRWRYRLGFDGEGGI